MPHPLAIADSNCSIKAHRYFRRMKNLPLKIHVWTISLFYLSVTSKKVSGYIEEDTIRYGQDTVLPSKNRVHVHNSLRTIKQFTLNHTVSLFPPYVTVLTQIVLSSTFIPRYVVAAAAAHKEIRAISVLTRGFREKDSHCSIRVLRHVGTVSRRKSLVFAVAMDMDYQQSAVDNKSHDYVEVSPYIIIK